MTDLKSLAALLERQNENQLALGAAIEEIALWLDARGSTQVVNNIRGALDTLDKNAGAIRRGINTLTNGKP